MKDYLFRNNLSVKQLAADLEISPSYLYQLIRGERKPSLELAQRIKTITEGEVTVGRLLGFSNEEGEDWSLHDQYVGKLQDIENSLETLHTKIDEIESRLSKLEK